MNNQHKQNNNNSNKAAKTMQQSFSYKPTTTQLHIPRANVTPRKVGVSVIPTPTQMPETKQFVYHITFLTLLQLCVDSVDRLINTYPVKGNYKWERAKIYDAFNSLRKKLKRQLTSEEFDFVENAIYDVVDELQPYIDNIEANAKSAFVQKMTYNLVDSAVLLGMAHGCTTCMQNINTTLTGKNNYLISVIRDNLAAICDQIEFNRLNPNDEIDPNHSHLAWKRLLENIPIKAAAIIQQYNQHYIVDK